jgi:spoIIIJ-associated protein
MTETPANADAAALERRVTEFVTDVVESLGLELTVTFEVMPDGYRVDLSGEGAEPMLRRKGEALDALQHIVNAVFRDEVGHDARMVVDCQGFRKAKDRELQHIARFLMEKVQATGVAQEMGPLNSYARRLVHLEVATAPGLASESVGDGALKRVIITRKETTAR